jgi:hypothetical protein
VIENVVRIRCYQCHRVFDTFGQNPSQNFPKRNNRRNSVRSDAVFFSSRGSFFVNRPVEKLLLINSQYLLLAICEKIQILNVNSVAKGIGIGMGHDAGRRLFQAGKLPPRNPPSTWSVHQLSHPRASEESNPADVRAELARLLAAGYRRMRLKLQLESGTTASELEKLSKSRREALDEF